MSKYVNSCKGGEISTKSNPCVYRIISTVMQTVLASITLRQHLRICGRKQFDRLKNVDRSLIMIDRYHQLLVYIMNGMARFLIFKLVNIRGSHNPDSHYKLMMRMMKMIVCRISTVSISNFNLIHPHPRQYLVTAHIPPSTQLMITIKKYDPREKISEEKLQHLLCSRAHFSELEVVISDKDIKVLLSFDNSAEDARRANMYLKFFEVPIIAANKKESMRKIAINFVKPKKSVKVLDLQEIPLLDVFEYSPVYSRFSITPKSRSPKWLKPLIIWIVNRYGIKECKHKDLVRLPVYINSKCSEITQIRIPHPDHPTIQNDILEMMRITHHLSINYNYIREGDILIPREILNMHQCWDYM
jgi:hypothetical protein